VVCGYSLIDIGILDFFCRAVVQASLEYQIPTPKQANAKSKLIKDEKRGPTTRTRINTQQGNKAPGNAWIAKNWTEEEN
jgi:hypothetical protein